MRCQDKRIFASVMSTFQLETRQRFEPGTEGIPSFVGLVDPWDVHDSEHAENFRTVSGATLGAAPFQTSCSCQLRTMNRDELGSPSKHFFIRMLPIVSAQKQCIVWFSRGMIVGSERKGTHWSSFYPLDQSGKCTRRARVHRTIHAAMSSFMGSWLHSHYHKAHRDDNFSHALSSYRGVYSWTLSYLYREGTSLVKMCCSKAIVVFMQKSDLLSALTAARFQVSETVWIVARESDNNDDTLVNCMSTILG